MALVGLAREASDRAMAIAFVALDAHGAMAISQDPGPRSLAPRTP